MRAIQITEFGGPEVLQQVELPDPVAGEGEVLIDVSRAGLNYADTHQAENSYLAKMELPLVPGGEVVGTTSDGRRVVALTKNSGGYAEKAVAPRAHHVRRAGRRGRPDRAVVDRSGRDGVAAAAQVDPHGGR